jgi:hypothetical protein
VATGEDEVSAAAEKIDGLPDSLGADRKAVTGGTPRIVSGQLQECTTHGYELTFTWDDGSETKEVFPLTPEGKKASDAAFNRSIGQMVENLDASEDARPKENIDHSSAEPLDEDMMMRTAMYFGLGMSRSEASGYLSIPWSQGDRWDDFWDSLEKTELDDILSGFKELEEDRYFASWDEEAEEYLEFFRLRPGLLPEVWVKGHWAKSPTLISSLREEASTIHVLHFDDAQDLFPHAFGSGEN